MTRFRLQLHSRRIVPYFLANVVLCYCSVCSLCEVLSDGVGAGVGGSPSPQDCVVPGGHPAPSFFTGAVWVVPSFRTGCSPDAMSYISASQTCRLQIFVPPPCPTYHHHPSQIRMYRPFPKIVNQRKPTTFLPTCLKNEHGTQLNKSGLQ